MHELSLHLASFDQRMNASESDLRIEEARLMLELRGNISGYQRDVIRYGLQAIATVRMLNAVRAHNEKAA